LCNFFAEFNSSVACLQGHCFSPLYVFLSGMSLDKILRLLGYTRRSGLYFMSNFSKFVFHVFLLQLVLMILMGSGLHFFSRIFG